MYSAVFIYEPGQYDDTFHALNALIDDIALSTQGYLGQESWRSKAGSKVNATYFWESMESLPSISKPSGNTGDGTTAITSSSLRSSSPTAIALSVTSRPTSVLARSKLFQLTVQGSVVRRLCHRKLLHLCRRSRIEVALCFTNRLSLR
jgi:hypothetical protein